MADTRMLDDLLLSRMTVDRAAHLRVDDRWQADRARDAEALVMWVSPDAAAVIAGDDPRLALTPITAVDTGPLSFLGVDDDGRAYYAAHVDDPAHASPDADVEWVSLRQVGHRLSDRDAGLLVTASALGKWRTDMRVCARCGGPLTVTQSGWAMRCEADGIDHFPRTDPAVIVLVRDRADRALLGRHVNWEAGWFSTFAGFVEAGESAEAAVRREVREETGIDIGSSPDDLAYLGSQPWPFPRSLMLGYHAWTDADEIRVDADEIAEAQWFTREALHEACASGAVRLPPPVSISRRLIERWFGSALPGEWLR